MSKVKVCIKCKKKLPFTCFSWGWRNANGERVRRNICKVCDNKRRATYRPSKMSNSSLAEALVMLSRYSPDRLDLISKDELTNSLKIDYDFSFNKVKNLARKFLTQLGYLEPNSRTITDQGNYLVIGDTCGKHTSSAMFSLLRNVIKQFDIKELFVVGNNLDDDFMLSYHFKDFPIPVTFIAKPEEIRILKNLKDSYGFRIVRDYVKIGDVKVKNQEQISPYTKQSLTSLDARLFPDSTIVNCTRHEYMERTVAGRNNHVFMASPGCLCKPHVKKVVKILNLSSGFAKQEVFADSFSKYRKQAEFASAYWEQGMIVVSIGKNGTYTNMLRIKQLEPSVYAVSTPFAVITSEVTDYVHKPESTSLVLADLHIPYQLSSFCERVFDAFGFVDQLILAGDIEDCEAVNHHILSTGGVVKSDYLEAYNAYCNFIKNVRSFFPYTTKVQVMQGNHEMFFKRFTDKFPQFAEFFKYFHEKPLLENSCVSVSAKSYINIGDETFVAHGDEHGFGNISGNNTEKHARMFRAQSIIGHSHSPQIRFGSYRIGCACQLDQGYNSPNFSDWRNGFAVVTTYKGKDFVSMFNLENTCIKILGGDELCMVDFYSK